MSEEISESELQILAESSIRRGTGTYQRRRERVPRNDLWQDERRSEPTPSQEPWARIIPERDGCEDEDASGCETPSGL